MMVSAVDWNSKLVMRSLNLHAHTRAFFRFSSFVSDANQRLRAIHYSTLDISAFDDDDMDAEAVQELRQHRLEDTVRKRVVITGFRGHHRWFAWLASSPSIHFRYAQPKSLTQQRL
jgi:hypothetical protein